MSIETTSVVLHQQVATLVVETSDGAAVISCGGSDVVLCPLYAVQVVSEGVQGPPGRPGPIGPAGGTAMERRAGETLSALRIVWEDEFGRVWPLSALDEAHVFLLLGLTLTAADAGGLVNVQRSGVVDDAAWSWAPGQRVYLGQGGALTASPAEEGFHVLVGTAASATRLLLNIQDPLQMWAQEPQGD
ncbi:capsid cement protein [Comamonas sp.]|uniref:capsid cement protein n=1 Tax=Comamonas sp. TaxID=34028 RepID=UPI00258425D9|nr:capsid cement protein [Comamonas sp.]